MKHRNALIAAASIAAVVFGGAIAVGANLGILTVADSSPVGQLSAATVATNGAPTQSGAPKPAAAPAATPKPAGSQAYLIKKAGSVKVAFGKKSVRLVDVNAKRHWTWTLAQTGDKKLTVTFKRGSSTYTFVAVVRGGKLTARVDHPVTKVITTASAGGSVSWAATPVVSPASTSHEGGDEHDSGGGNAHEGGGADD
jgi:hypothetical protein